MTEPDATQRGLFRRFPWLQLVFCLACLSMAAWTWLRYSYAWDVTPRMLVEGFFSVPLADKRPDEAYVSLSGTTTGLTCNQECVDCLYIEEADGSGFGLGLIPPGGAAMFDSLARALAARDERRGSADGSRTEGGESPRWGLCEGIELVDGSAWTVTGRFRWPGVRAIRGGVGTYVDATASRFHPASVAGLVVGAMGCFIFGLYLRRWLVERKAAARAETVLTTETQSSQRTS